MSDMTITAVRTTMLRVPWPQTPWLKGHAFGDARNFLVLDVETKGGITGMGYLFLFRPGIRSIIACLDEVIIPRVIGKDASAVEAIWQDLWKTTITFGRGGIATMAMSALDIALWDALGKKAKLPLHRLWGHYRSQMPAYGSGCFRGSGGDGMIAKALHYKERGYKAIKMQVAHVGSLATDLDNVKRMREAVGPDIDIMIDVNMGWTADIAIQMGRKFQDYDVYWLEEPVVPDDFAGYLRIAASARSAHRRRRDPFHPLRSQTVLRESAAADPAARPDARRHDRAAQDRDRRRHLGHDHGAASVPRTERAAPRLDPERDLDRGHGACGRFVCRSRAGGERHDHRAGTAGTWAGIQAGNPARLRRQELNDQARPAPARA